MSEPPASDPSILLLGGTADANRLAEALIERFGPRSIIFSLAGRTGTPRLPANVEIRVGGFGGASGLAAFLIEHRIDLLIDATHPFAAGIARNAAKAADEAGVRRIKLARAPWTTKAGDDWHEVSCLAEARDALPPGARPLLALGRQHLSPFMKRQDLRPLARMIEQPDPPLPDHWTLVLARPSPEWPDEAELMERHGVTHLVSRNAGGTASYAKIEAARRLGLPVVMIERPSPVPGETATSIEEVMARLDIRPAERT